MRYGVENLFKMDRKSHLGFLIVIHQMRLKKSNSYVQTDLFRTLLQCSFPSPGGGGVGMLLDDTKLVNGFACLGGYIGDYVFILDLLFVLTICPSSSVETANIKKKTVAVMGIQTLLLFCHYEMLLNAILDFCCAL